MPMMMIIMIILKIELNTVILLWTLYCTEHRNWFHESLVMLEHNITTSLSKNQFRCLVQYSVHKRITVFRGQGQGKNKQMFVVEIDISVYVIFISMEWILILSYDIVHLLFFSSTFFELPNFHQENRFYNHFPKLIKIF